MSSYKNTKHRVNLLQRISVCVLVFCAIFFGSCTTSSEKTGIVTVEFVNQDGSVSRKFNLLTASNSKERQKGLMFVKSMPESEGMLFLFPEESELSFWMRNTYIPLDMIFLGSDFNVRGVIENVPILNDLPRGISDKSQYVVELNAGLAQKEGIKRGSHLKLFSKLPDIS